MFGHWVRSSYKTQNENQSLLSANLVPESAILQPHERGQHFPCPVLDFWMCPWIPLWGIPQFWERSSWRWHHGTHGQVCSKLMPSAGYDGLETCKFPISEGDNGTKLLLRVNLFNNKCSHLPTIFFNTNWRTADDLKFNCSEWITVAPVMASTLGEY